MFHVKDGWFFSRGQEGLVFIEIRKDGKWDGDVVQRIAIDADSWASVVSIVSARGENSLTFKEALDFHMREAAAQEKSKEGAE